MNVAVCHGNYLSNEILAPTVEIRNSVSPRADTPPADAPPPKKKSLRNQIGPTKRPKNSPRISPSPADTSPKKITKPDRLRAPSRIFTAFHLYLLSFIVYSPLICQRFPALNL